MTVGKVKDFNFSSAGKTVGYCGGGSVKMTKMASGGYYAKGGSITEKATGETYPSRSAMVKHEALETPSMQKQEMVQKSTVRSPALKLKAGRASAGKAAIPPQMAMKTGGFVARGSGMIPDKESLGVKNNKNPGESGGKAPVKSHPAYNFKKGGDVKKYAIGGPTASKQGALQAMKAAASKKAPQQRPTGLAPPPQQRPTGLAPPPQQRMAPQESPMRAPPPRMEQMAAQMAQRGPSPQQMAPGAGGRGLPPQEAPMRAPPRGLPQQSPMPPRGAAAGLKKGGIASRKEALMMAMSKAKKK